MRNTGGFAAPAGALVMAALALTACTSEEEAEFGETATPASPTMVATLTVEERAEAEALLKTAALRAEDLPEGFTLEDEGFTTNEDVVEEEGDSPGVPTLEDLNRFGRILGYDASYSQEVSPDSPLEDTLALGVSIELYRDSGGAREAFDWMNRLFSDPELIKAWQEQASGEGVEDIQDTTISAIPFAEVGDDRAAYEIKLTAHTTGIELDYNLTGHLVAILRGRAIASVTVMALRWPGPLQELEELTSQELDDLARTLDERMKDALEQNPSP